MSALAQGYYRDAGVDLHVQQPSASTDAPKLLEAGRAQFAILDIHDLAIARERGLDVVGVVPIVERPLAAVIAANRDRVRRPSDLEGATVGVTGLPSDDAVLDSVIRAGGGDPSSVHRVTIGFQAVSALAAGKVDAATAFWNAEGVTLRRMGVPTREFRVDQLRGPALSRADPVDHLEADRIRPSPGPSPSSKRPGAVTTSPSSDRDWHWAPCSTARRASIAPRSMPSFAALLGARCARRPPARARR